MELLLYGVLVKSAFFRSVEAIGNDQCTHVNLSTAVNSVLEELNRQSIRVQQATATVLDML